MKNKLDSLRKDFELVKNGGGDILAIRDRTLSVLKQCREFDDQKVLDELEYVLLDLEFILNNIKCNCHSRSCLKK